MSLTAWWSAWKYVLILALLLIASVGWNLHQWKHAGVIKEQARADAYADALKATAGIAKQAQVDGKTLLDAIQAIADQRVRTQVIYTKAASAQPLAANCAPGRGRMDAVNNGVPPTSTPGEVR